MPCGPSPKDGAPGPRGGRERDAKTGRWLAGDDTLSLGRGASARFLYHGGERVGILFEHGSGRRHGAVCVAALYWTDAHLSSLGREDREPREPATFEMEETSFTLESPPDATLTISEPIACSCGAHGRIRGGKWIAG